MFSVIVKGSRFDSARAAAARGIGLVYVRETRPNAETLALTGASLDALQRWLGEAPHAAPYPCGALLHFSEVSEARASEILREAR